MTLTVRSKAGESVVLSDQPVGQGGEAQVYTVPAFPNVAVKIYHPNILAQRGAALRTKIEVMCNDPKFKALQKNTVLAWPRFSVFDEKGEWIGFAMRQVTGKKMHILAHAKAYQAHFPNLDRPTIAAYLINLLKTVEQLHQVGVLIGDYNPANFLCDTTNPHITLIDCDSWQFCSGNQIFRCPVSVPDMLAPELLDQSLSQVTRSIESERFSLACLLFRALMLGRSPFDAIGSTDPVANIRRGYFPYGLGGGGIPPGKWFNIWSHLSFKIKEQMVKTFRDGTHQPHLRTTVLVWKDILTLYRKEMLKGFHSTEIAPQKPKPRDYLGRQQSLSQISV